MPRRGSSKPPAEPVVKPYGCDFSTASAVGLYQSVIGFVIVMVVNWVVKKIEPDYALF